MPPPRLIPTESGNWVHVEFIPGGPIVHPGEWIFVPGETDQSKLLDYKDHVRKWEHWDDTPPTNAIPGLDPDAQQKLADMLENERLRHDHSGPIDKGGGDVSRGRTLVIDPNCKMDFSGYDEHYSAWQTAWLHDDLSNFPPKGEEKIWDDKRNSNDTRNYIGGRKPDSTMPGYDDFIKSYERYKKSLEALRELKDLLKGEEGVDSFKQRVAAIAQKYAGRAEEADLLGVLVSIIGTPIGGAIAFTADGYANGLSLVLSDISEAIGGLDYDGIVDLFLTAMDSIYQTMVTKYLEFVRANNREGNSPNGRNTNSLCPDDAETLKKASQRARDKRRALESALPGTYKLFSPAWFENLNVLELLRRD